MTQITITLEDEQNHLLCRRADAVGQSVEEYAARLMSDSLNGPTDDPDVLDEAHRRRADGLVGRPADEIFDRLDQKHGVNTR